MASAVSIMRPALRLTSSRAFRSRSVYDRYPEATSPRPNTTRSTRLNFSLRPMPTLPARGVSRNPTVGHPRVRARESDEADRDGVGPRLRPRGPEPELQLRAPAALELGDEVRVVGGEDRRLLAGDLVGGHEGVVV